MCCWLLLVVCLVEYPLGAQQVRALLIMVKEPKAAAVALHLWGKQGGKQAAQGSRAGDGDTHRGQHRS